MPVNSCAVSEALNYVAELADLFEIQQRVENRIHAACNNLRKAHHALNDDEVSVIASALKGSSFSPDNAAFVKRQIAKS